MTDPVFGSGLGTDRQVAAKRALPLPKKLLPRVTTESRGYRLYQMLAYPLSR